MKKDNSNPEDIEFVPEKNQGKRVRLFNMFLFPILIGAVTWGFMNVICLVMYVPTGSMDPDIRAKSICIGCRVAYAFEKPKRGDIVVFDHKESNKLLVKRIIGLPGDTITLQGSTLYLNGEIYEESYLKDTPIYTDAEFVVPEGHYFCLGDNRNDSLDARFWESPFISLEDITAKNLVNWGI